MASSYKVTTQTLTGGWDLVSPGADVGRVSIIADSVGVGMLWSTNAAPVTGEGIPFSLSGSPGSWEFTEQSSGKIYVKGPAAAVLTVAVA